jgi:diguanylate cyclase (GGDEF)-like protein
VAKARILAIDDQLYFRVFLEDLLGQEGYAVEVAAGGEEALARLEAEAFDLVLTDLVMPGMDGLELVQRVRQCSPTQEIVVITSVGDVTTAVDAMKLGATDYLLKPIDKTALLRAVEAVLRNKRIREEHGRLMAENLEFMGVFSLYERCSALYTTLALAPLADRLAELLSLETGAQGAVVWVEETPGCLALAAARGIVRLEAEARELRLDALPPEVPRFDAAAPEVQPACGPPAPLLWVPLAQDGRLLALARLSDRLEGEGFGDRERAAARKLSGFAAGAVRNALRFRELSQRSFRDPATQAYSRAYFQDVVRNELQKAERFGRALSLVRVEVGERAPTPARPPDAAPDHARAATSRRLARSLRATDLFAVDGEGRFWILLTETDALGAAVLKRRLREILEGAAPDGEAGGRPSVAMGSVSYPGDGSRLEVLEERLDARVAEDAESRAHDLRGAAEPFGRLLERLVAEAPPGRPELADQVVRLLLREVGRRPHERGVLYVAPGAVMAAALRDGLETLRGQTPRTEIVLVTERAPAPGWPVTWVSPVRSGTRCPFLVYCGEGPAYALAQAAQAGAGPPALFHTSDRPLVEHLAFALGRDLGLQIGA